MSPSIRNIVYSKGPTSGGELVRIFGKGFAEQVEVFFGDVPALVINVYREAALSIITLRSPQHVPGFVNVTVLNQDDAGESVESANAYLYQRPRVVEEADLTRLIRHLLRILKAQVLQNTSLAVSVDYQEPQEGGAHLIPLAELPGIILSGPTLTPNAFYTKRAAHEDVVIGVGGPEILRRLPSQTVDLHFTLVVASERTAELLNLMVVMAQFFSRNLWIELPRDSARPNSGVVRWEMDPEDEYRTNLRSQGGVYTFSIGLVIRGFDLHEGTPLDLTQIVNATDLKTSHHKEPS